MVIMYVNDELSLQVLHVQYGMYVWPCAVVLAQYLWFHRRSLPGKAVLEVTRVTKILGYICCTFMHLN